MTASCRRTRGHALNEQSSRSHAIVTLHFDSWAEAGSAEDQDAAQGEQLYQLLQRARAVMGASGEESVPAAASDDDDGFEASGGGGGDGGASTRTETMSQGDVASLGVVEAQIHDSPNATRSASQRSGRSVVDTPGPSRSLDSCTAAAASPSQGHDGAPVAAHSISRRMKRYGKLVLVDLAGSERLKASGSSGSAAVTETGAINKSLFTLGQVLHALSCKRGGRPQQVCTTLFSCSQDDVCLEQDLSVCCVPVLRQCLELVANLLSTRAGALPRLHLDKAARRWPASRGANNHARVREPACKASGAHCRDTPLCQRRAAHPDQAGAAFGSARQGAHWCCCVVCTGLLQLYVTQCCAGLRRCGSYTSQ